jgi:hypothetical protein
MTSFLSAYRNFINVLTKEGLTLLSNATDKFDCPLKDDECISLCSGGHDYQKLKDTLLRCSQRFGYQHLLNHVVTTCVVTPAIQAVQANPNANPPVQAVVGVPQSITYFYPIKVLEVYLDKLLDILAQKNASLIWGDQSFTDQNPKEIFELTAANGNLTNTGRLNTAGKKVVQQCILSKILAQQTLAMLTDEACQVIEQQSDVFTWKDLTGNEDEEMDGLTIIALILRRLHPHHKVDMYAEIGKAKKLTVAQFDNDIHSFFDAMKSIKLQTDQRDSSAYTDDAFVRDLFLQLKDESLPSDFKHEFTALEHCWQMDKEIVPPQSLMDDAGTYYTNLVGSGSWQLESKHSQIITLTTQISELKMKIQSLTSTHASNKSSMGPAADKPQTSLRNYGNFEVWRLVKINNNAEFNMVEKGNKKFHWCDEHQYPGSDVKGMYVFHKPTEHDAWKARKDFHDIRHGKKLGSKDTQSTTPASTPSVAASTVSTSASKLSLAKSLQEALTTTARVTEDQFNKIWQNCCDFLGN